MNKTIKVASLFILSGVASVSIAATEGFYLGAGLGAGRLDTPKENFLVGDDVDADKKSYKRTGLTERAFAGYNFSRYLGIEASLAHYTPADYNTVINNFLDASVKYTVNSADLVGKVYLPFAETGLNLYALGGVAYVNSKTEVKLNVNSPLAQVPSVKVSESETINKIRPKYGFGISYDFQDAPVTANLEFSRIQGTGELKNKDGSFKLKDVGIPNVDTVTLNVAYNFG